MTERLSLEPEIANAIWAEALYKPYAERHHEEVQRMEQAENVRIPSGFDFSMLPGLSNELRGKLAAASPRTIRDLQRIEGMTPAAVILVLARLKAKGVDCAA